MSKRVIIVGISDTHAGHRLGLCNPETKLKDIIGGEVVDRQPELLEVQRWMWGVYQRGIEKAVALAGNDDIILIHNGDPTHGKAPFLETASSRMADQLLIAAANIEPWLSYPNVKAVRFTVGTGIHELGEGSSSLLVTSLLARQFPQIDISVVYHGIITINGYTIDYAHHGPPIGTRKWLEGNNLRYYLQSLMMTEIIAGRTPPNLVLRGHYHTYRREYLEIIAANGKVYGSWAVLLPGFTFKDDHARKVSRSDSRQSVGMVAFELIDNHLYRTHIFAETVDIRTREVICSETVTT